MSLFSLPGDSDPSAILERLQEAFPLQLLETSRERVAYYDTFDWRLTDGGYTLTAAPAGGRVRLTLSADEGEIMEIRSPRLPDFASDLEEGPFRDTLARFTKVRRLLLRARAVWSRRTWAVLNEDQKTVARIVVREGSAKTPEDRDTHPIPPRLQLLPLKGYRTEYRRVRAGLRRAGALKTPQKNELVGILEALGETPERHSSSTILTIPAGIPAEAAARLIHRELLLTMEVNLDGVLKDLDSEFLHEFRVAGRKARSALSQIKGVFPESAVKRFGEELRWVGSQTGATRDLDVYILKIPAYQASLPEGVREELLPLTRFLDKRKKQAHRRLVRSLTSKRYHDLVTSWSAFLEEPAVEGPLPPPNAGRPVEALARERILTVFRKILKKGSRIQPGTPAEALHRLRITCKQLRYLLTLFQSLFPPEALGPLIKELKALQDNLGDFNDLRLQANALHSFAEEMMTLGVGPPATLMAMGQLMGQLEEKQIVERGAFSKRFKTFARRENRKRFEELFG
ncbi:MAG: CHAD domain-containing protein [Longimicrobiales bacterium]